MSKVLVIRPGSEVKGIITVTEQYLSRELVNRALRQVEPRHQVTVGCGCGEGGFYVFCHSLSYCCC